ncbi:MAG TPA: response regulator [Candidatus Sulfotelmatobacter sp.]|nr:response regulator [Candidatus Sulfotelmatobacter sp.]
MNKPRVLIAEDEPHLREVLRFQLEAAGFEVLVAEDGQRAVDLALEQLPDVLLCDVMMPHLDGFEVTHRLRAAYATRHIPIVMLTAKAEADDKVHGLQGGANDYVTKPWQQKELVLRIRNVLEWSRQQRSASPLTGLPGNLSINEEVERRLASGEPFAFLQIDIDFFKAFNDRYGYARGDQAIQALARIIVETVQRHGQSNFVGHIGGDDFIVVSTPPVAEALGRDILAQFDAAAKAFYDAEDLDRGHVEVHNRRHVLERFPLMSLTIALVSTDRMPVTHLAQLTDISQELKAHGKSMPGSVLVNERRQGGESADRNAAA